jgi:hypothetical protein
VERLVLLLLLQVSYQPTCSHSVSLHGCLQVAVHFMGGVAEALLQLPEVPFSRPDAAEAAGVPPGLWLTVGLLAADGFALQLRLRKADKVCRAPGLPGCTALIC